MSNKRANGRSYNEMGHSKSLSDDTDHRTSNLAPSPDNRDAAARMERLWNKLVLIWPAKNRDPEVANRIEELLNYLKDDHGGSPLLSASINELIGAESASTTTDADSSTNSAEIDELITEILGENYRLETTPESEVSESDSSAKNANTAYITGSKELDDMVAAILGEGWEKEDVVAEGEQAAPIDTQAEAMFEPQEILENLPLDNDDDFDLDALVNSILTDHEITTPAQPIESTIKVDDESAVDIADITASESEPVDSAISSDFDELTKFSDLEPTAPTDDPLKVAGTTAQIIKADATDMGLDELIDQILHSEEEESAASEVSVDSPQNISPIDFEETISTKYPLVSSSPLSDEDANNPLRSTNTTSTTKITHQTPIQKKTKQTVTARPQITPIIDSRSKIMGNEEGNKRSGLMRLLLLIILLILMFGLWQYLIPSDNTAIVSHSYTAKKVIKPPVIKEYTSPPIVPAEDLHEPAITKQNPFSITPEAPEDYLAEPQESYSPEPQDDYSPEPQKSDLEEPDESDFGAQKMPTYDNNEYDSRIDRSEKEITIIIHEPVVKERTVPPVNMTAEKTEKIEKIDDAASSSADKVAAPKSTKKLIIHKIVKGDTLWGIAKRYINDPYRYPELARLSKIKNPDRIYPGNRVRIIIYSK